MTETPAQAAARAAARYGFQLTGQAADDIAAAVLACADTKVGVKAFADRNLWAQPDYREHLRRDLRHKIVAEIADKGYLPAAAFKETLVYLPPGHWMPGTTPDHVPAELAESGDAAWETVEIRLSAPVRKGA